VEIWQSWYQPFFDFIDNHRDVIRVVAYINTQWDSQPMWRCWLNTPAGEPGCPNGNRGDSRLYADDYIKAKWLEEISNID
jgi:hypothetical protein